MDWVLATIKKLLLILLCVIMALRIYRKNVIWHKCLLKHMQMKIYDDSDLF